LVQLNIVLNLIVLQDRLTLNVSVDGF